MPTKTKNKKLNIEYTQKGLASLPEFAHFATFHLKSDLRKGYYQKWVNVVKNIEKECVGTKNEVVCVAGVDFNLWKDWCSHETMPKPVGDAQYDLLHNKPFIHTGGDLWFHIKGNTEKGCEEIFNQIVNLLDSDTQGDGNDKKNIQDTRASKMHGGKVFGGRFIDGLVNPVDEVNLSANIVVGEEDDNYRGASFVIQQKFKHNWDQLNDMNLIEMENMIGRNHQNTIIPMREDRSHIRCARHTSGEKLTQKIFRQALPYGSSGVKGQEEGVYFVAYTKTYAVYDDLIQSIVGPEAGFVKDKMLSNSHAVSGNFWFVPPAKYAGVSPDTDKIDVPLNDYFNLRSKNGLMYYNTKDFLHQAGGGSAEKLEISDRILLLLSQVFSRWNDTWDIHVKMPPLGHLQGYLEEPRWKEYKDKLQKKDSSGKKKSAALRKGLAIKISLSDVLLRQQFRDEALLYNIKPHEIIVGNMPPLTLGSGSQVMEYLDEQEKIEAFFGMRNEYSSAGHNIPNYKKLLRVGVKGLLEEVKGLLHEAVKKGEQGGKDSSSVEFYQSAVWSLEGLSDFIMAYSTLAGKMKNATPTSAVVEIKNYHEIENRMKRLATEKPEGLLESIQLIFITNCALHQIGEPMSIGRIDQLLIEAYNNDKNLSEHEAQDIIDAFWLKMDETVLYNRQFMNDYLTYGTGAIFYSASNFPQGSALNQWVQQATVGGYLPNGSEPGDDGCNEITLMSLRSARRLPLNAPCLSLRLHKNMNKPIHEKIFKEAARAILSGGAHPVLINDDKLVEGLVKSGVDKIADARDFTCDGCFEPIIGGKSEWAFSYIPLLPIVGMAMNQGATIEGAGWIYLRGLKSSWNSPPPETIKTFDELIGHFYTHLKWAVSTFYNTLMNGYGALWDVCPSPLFSSMTDGCLESGRDMTNGGAEYHIISPMLNGITNTINSLYAIKKMVYDNDTAVTTLPELLEALWNNWGFTMQEPFQNVIAGKGRSQDRAAYYKELRKTALALPKFGEGKDKHIKEFGANVVERCVQIIVEGLEEKTALPSIYSAYQELKKKYAIEGREFKFTVTPGVGTFEDNIGLGIGMGASADGRLSGETIADDFSAVPSPSDQPPRDETYDIYKGLSDWNVPSINIGLSNTAPVDINVREDFPLEGMEKVIRDFAKGEIGSNLLTITTADQETYKNAAILPDKYDLVRIRQGGWSEFYAMMFPLHQEYIIRRPYYGLKK